MNFSTCFFTFRAEEGISVQEETRMQGLFEVDVPVFVGRGTLVATLLSLCCLEKISVFFASGFERVREPALYFTS
ncbi:MAG: hypothetical protein FJZ58_06595 [Chlamydiae bacterium]|nr:hypothetical protein [Chlamydiota bacterium]